MEENDIRREIIRRIRTNRISTTEVADCLGKSGNVEGLSPVNEGHFQVGEVFLAYAYGESNWELHEQLEQVQEGQVVVVETHGCSNRAAFGDLVAKYTLLYRQAIAMVVNGLLRDAHSLKKNRYPLWCRGLTPIGCFNRPNQAPLDQAVLQSWKERYEGSVAVCDDGGAVIIPRRAMTREFLSKLEFIELQEDIWYYCIDTKKWSTYRTVCLKDYLDAELLPSELRQRLGQFREDSSD